MRVVINKVSSQVTAFFSIFFRLAEKQADHKRLSRHILALNQKNSSEEIIDEVSHCLKDIINYRLFAFVIQQKDAVDVWLDPRMYKQSLEHIIQKDFHISRKEQINYLNHTFEQNENQQNHSLRNLISYELKEEGCTGKIYMLPNKAMYSYHDEIINIVLKSAGVAISKQLNIKALKNAAVIDPLTGCYNRREFENHLNRNIASSIRHKHDLSVFMFDLDYFKKINDTHGHLAGDKVLREIAALVQNNMRKDDILARYGGEEFIAILPRTNKNKAMELADRLRVKILKKRIKYNNETLKVTASFGVADLNKSADMTKIIHDADTMLYKAKLNGRNTVMPGLIKICSDVDAQDIQEHTI